MTTKKRKAPHRKSTREGRNPTKKRHVQVWLKWFRILPRPTVGNASEGGSSGSWSPEDSEKKDMRKEGPDHPSDGIQTWQLELMNQDPWSCFSTFLQPHFMALIKLPELFLQSTSALNSKRKNFKFRSYVWFLPCFSVMYEVYLTAVYLLFYLLSQQNIGTGR